MLCRILRKSSRRIAIVTAAVSIITLAAAAPSGAYIDGDEVIQPPTTGEYAYGVYGPNAAGFPAIGPIYRHTGDPKFGGKVRRITNEFPNLSKSDIYSKNGFWSADGKLMFHLDTSETQTVINTITGQSVPVPGDYNGFDGSFAPNDSPGGPYHWYYFSGSMLKQYVITMQSNGSLVAFDDPMPVRDFREFRARTLGLLGGSVDWIDNNGRYLVLNLDGKVRVWNKETNTLYSGSVGAAGADWIGISPDGNFVVTSTDKGFSSYAINHSARTLTTKGVLFWTLCGGHGDLVTASDLKTYLVTFDCYGESTPTDGFNKPAVYAVNVGAKTSVSGRTESSRNLQRRNPANKRLFQLEWHKSGDGHIAGVSKGPLRNWVFVSLEAATVTVDGTTQGDILNTPVDPKWWQEPYIQEIVMANVITGEVRRLAHHRSRSIDNSYYYQPRVSAGWGSCDGATVAWASNFGVANPAGYADIYAIDVDATTAEKAAAGCP